MGKTDSKMDKTQQTSFGHKTCTIVGAGVGGLAAAAALSPIFGEIVILEKDGLPNSPESRKSVPQSAHLHSLLIGGSNLLEQIFPGIMQEVVTAGGCKLRAGIDQQVYEFGNWMPVRDLGVDIFAQSRPLLEYVMRQKVLSLPNVKFLEHTRATQLDLDSSGKITALRISGMDAKTHSVNTDMVVDASGLSGKLIHQLISLIPAIEEKKEIVQSNIVYVSAIVKKPREWIDHHENILVIAEPAQSAGGALIDIEGNRWCVSLHGRNGLEPPSDFAEWKLFAKQLPADRIWDRVKNCELMGKLAIFKKPVSYLRRFDLIANLPGNYFPLGDTISSVNPTFGQGMTLALGHAQFLKNHLLSDPDSSHAEYIQQAVNFSYKAWRRTVAYDSMFLPDEKKINVMRSLALAKHQQAVNDAQKHKEFLNQAQMLS